MTTYRAARVHLGAGTDDTVLHVRDGVVVASQSDDDVVDLGDVELLPGFVDVHADSLARFEQPRPGVGVPLPHALDAFAADALLAGVTTAFLCCSIEPDTVPTRSAEHAAAVLDALATTPLPIDVRVHLRVDVTDDGTVDALERLVAGAPARIGLVSYMDHTPGRGQYPDEAGWRRAYRALDRLGNDELDARLDRFRRGAAGVPGRRERIAAVARAAGVVLAAHDDDSAEAVRTAAHLGAGISEFPVTSDAAETATTAGLGVVVGAPNLWRGGSHGSGPSARSALVAGHADVVTSDYHLGSLLPGLRAAAAAGVAPFDDLVRTVTAAPARHTGLDDRGSLTPGHRADVVAIRGERVVGVWVAGQRVLART
ncbi:alpha-D-ribose 1-methylphosphonate 5-triphosphate diphosphatase [Curtobacterium flaccumfaciens pv. oortii]|uniref:alpha-D-ribose 1-methylphosphonate 5-triphosphate diphosphatase n=1 Tax=Curtobacterium flaccumfaciens TaxID=2035 RepID=UPI001BDEEDC5|nr:alpha-D-ribose 1-methylphosphonate 5-triphosphate diphosphatase [Curtobacterium flaccumfaciens]MBT1623998.1 alpha-D-ribose 1-methylphosphonate 5-triphosphate diphosphatase [Curtobacterium flaccumfaciens pv. oortii]